MPLITRRTLLAAGGTLAAGAAVCQSTKSVADELLDTSALKPTEPPVTPPDVSFTDAAGKQHHLNEFRGHGMVINLWATWCMPCVAEMPSLDALSRTLAPDDIAVMPLSSDHGGVAAVQAFYREHGIRNLPILLDPDSAAAHALKLRGIPTTLIIDRQGREVARLEGSADWSTGAAAATVRKFVAKGT